MGFGTYFATSGLFGCTTSKRRQCRELLAPNFARSPTLQRPLASPATERLLTAGICFMTSVTGPCAYARGYCLVLFAEAALNPALPEVLSEAALRRDLEAAAVLDGHVPVVS